MTEKKMNSRWPMGTPKATNPRRAFFFFFFFSRAFCSVSQEVFPLLRRAQREKGAQCRLGKLDNFAERRLPMAARLRWCAPDAAQQRGR